MTDDSKCGATDDDHLLMVKVEYDVEENSEGLIDVSAATIHSHAHNVPTEVAAQTLTMIAVKILSDHMAHEQFENVSDHLVAHTMGTAASKAFLIASIQALPDSIELLSVNIPDDLSELLEEGN